MSELNKNGKEKQGRLIALIIAGSVLSWSVLQGAAPSLGISARYMLLISRAYNELISQGKGLRLAIHSKITQNQQLSEQLTAPAFLFHFYLTRSFILFHTSSYLYLLKTNLTSLLFPID